MKQALMIIGNEDSVLITAEKAQYEDYPRIYKCPKCEAALELRAAYQTRNGKYYPPAFRHPGNGVPCRERVEYGIQNLSLKNPFDAIGRGQSNKKIEASILKCMKFFLIGMPAKKRPYLLRWKLGDSIEMNTSIPKQFSVFDNLAVIDKWIRDDKEYKRLIEYNLQSKDFHDNPQQLLKLAASILKSKSIKRFFLQRIDEIEKQSNQDYLIFREYFSGKQKSVWWQRLYQEKYSKSINSRQIEDWSREHFYHTRELLKYITGPCSDSMYQELAEIILLSSPSIPVSMEHTLNPKVYQNYSRQFKNKSRLAEHREAVKQRRLKASSYLRSIKEEAISELLLKPNLLDEAIKSFYGSRKTPIAKFIKILVEREFKIFQKFDWSILPLFY